MTGAVWVCLIRLLKGDFTPQKHFGFEAAAWYWHFVDVVWLALFLFGILFIFSYYQYYLQDQQEVEY